MIMMMRRRMIIMMTIKQVQNGYGAHTASHIQGVLVAVQCKEGGKIETLLEKFISVVKW